MQTKPTESPNRSQSQHAEPMPQRLAGRALRQSRRDRGHNAQYLNNPHSTQHRAYVSDGQQFPLSVIKMASAATAVAGTVTRADANSKPSQTVNRVAEVNLFSPDQRLKLSLKIRDDQIAIDDLAFGIQKKHGRKCQHPKLLRQPAIEPR